MLGAMGLETARAVWHDVAAVVAFLGCQRPAFGRQAPLLLVGERDADLAGCSVERLLEHSVLLPEVVGLARHPLAPCEGERGDDELDGDRQHRGPARMRALEPPCQSASSPEIVGESPRDGFMDTTGVGRRFRDGQLETAAVLG